MEDCKHTNRTCHFSDVFGYYESCLDCHRDLDNKIVEETEKCKKNQFVLGFFFGVLIYIIGIVLNNCL